MNNWHHPLAFVPTMGALHSGHESLITLAREFAEEVVVSVFVNPLQFENPEDLKKYPRTPQVDAARAKAAGATQVWFPTESEIYPGSVERMSSGTLGGQFEGASRAGHFDGMLTVVKRLFDLVQPEWAIFGEKDFQQLFLIKKMVADLGLPIEIVAAPLIRDSDGLALSSRNVRLSDSDRACALVIVCALAAAKHESNPAAQRSVLHQILSSESGFRLDYAEVIDEQSFQIAKTHESQNRAIVAGWVNGVRLLDNMAMNSHKVAQ